MIHPLGGAAVGPGDTTPATNSTRMLDHGTATVLIAAGTVSGVLSAQGAHAMFAGSWLMAVVFAVALQIIISIALWLLPQQSLRTKLMMVPAYVLAFAFSVGSAYFSAYQANASEMAGALKSEVVQAFSQINGNLDALEETARRTEEAAADEDKNGTYSQGVSGKKKKWRELQQEALARRASSDQAQPARDRITSAMQALRADRLGSDEVRNIYDDVATASGRYMTGVKTPDFVKDQRSFAAVVLGAYQIALGLRRDVSDTERRRVLGSLFSSSIMEILALMASLIRAVAFATRRASIAEYLAMPVAFCLSLIYLPQEVRLRASRLRDRAVEAASRWQERLEHTLELLKDPNPSVMEQVWRGNLRAQAKAMGRRSIVRLIRDVLPREVALRHLVTGLPLCTVSLFDASGFGKKHIMLNGALTTRVLAIDSHGVLIPGPRWDQWVRCMLSLLAEPEVVASRSTTRSRPQLRVVGRQ